ncbi:cobyrinic acid a,c-diamide synthase [Modestobacter sp. I12A-02628]|uniref:Cobalamin biosynthesis protein n=1 Tax=Goekera deserti TaxID=2497753 RepID=A0A7K3WEI3_9ACTN|nr:cobalamin biosynthesis protein [Goekera deserti]MPQ98069.1 cobyrinic acid a,c-diamide synthase [Goekera deserti]NDI48716.1 cobyrinic acid a,c-diamide synthase [Goekera deserti]NEL54905.1 cobalamin biosynthesis protein [Goekera deserti]
MPRPEAVVGVGARRGVTAAEVLAAVDAVLPPGVRVGHLATLDVRAAEPGVQAAAAQRGWRLTGHPAAALAAVVVPTPSARAAAAVGTPSVAEAAALLGGGELLVPKTVLGRVTTAVARPIPRPPATTATSAETAGPTTAVSAERAGATAATSAERAGVAVGTATGGGAG